MRKNKEEEALLLTLLLMADIRKKSAQAQQEINHALNSRLRAKRRSAHKRSMT